MKKCIKTYTTTYALTTNLTKETIQFIFDWFQNENKYKSAKRNILFLRINIYMIYIYMYILRTAYMYVCMHLCVIIITTIINTHTLMYAFNYATALIKGLKQ